MGDDQLALGMVLRLADQKRILTLEELLAGLEGLPPEIREGLARSVAAYSFPELVERLAKDQSRKVREAFASNPKAADHPALAIAAVRAAAATGDRAMLVRWSTQPRVTDLPEAVAIILKDREAACHLARKAPFARSFPAFFRDTFRQSLQSGRLSAARACLANPRVFEFPDVVLTAGQHPALATVLLANRHLREYPSVVPELAQLPAMRRELAAMPWIHGVGRAVDSIIASGDEEAIGNLLSKSAGPATLQRVAAYAAADPQRDRLADRILRHIGSSPEHLRRCLESDSGDGVDCSAIETVAAAWVRRRSQVPPGAEPPKWILAAAPFMPGPVPVSMVEQVIEACAGITFKFQPAPTVSTRNLPILVKLNGDAVFRRGVFSCCLASECEAHVLASAAISLSRMVETNHRDLLARLRASRPDFSESAFGSIVMSAIRVGGTVTA